MNTFEKGQSNNSTMPTSKTESKTWKSTSTWTSTHIFSPGFKTKNLPTKRRNTVLFNVLKCWMKNDFNTLLNKQNKLLKCRLGTIYIYILFYININDESSLDTEFDHLMKFPKVTFNCLVVRKIRLTL